MAVVGLMPQLVRDEGVVEYAYPDSLGYTTIGCGHLIDRRKGGKLSPAAINFILNEDITQKSAEVYERFPWVMDLDEPRKATIINMAFQLGIDGLAQFTNALMFMKNGEYTSASIAFADSKVAKEQTPERWARHCAQIKTGVWQ